MSYSPSAERYSGMSYRRCGLGGLKLPAISLGLWQNFGGNDVFETGRAILRRAFDRGVTHFDLANNYGPPYGSAESNFGRWMASDFAPYRDELLISTKAGYDMWPGPYGGPSGSRKHLIASCEQSLKRMGLDYVDIFYSHRMDADTPLEETCAALAQLHRQGKALYVGISSYTPDATRRAAALLAAEGITLLIHQPRYSMFDRTIEDGLLDALAELGSGCVAFSPLAQGLLGGKYLRPSERQQGRVLAPDAIDADVLRRIRGLAELAGQRGQSLAQMAIAWVLRDERITSALVGARTVAQLDDTLAALDDLSFAPAELAAIDALTRSDRPLAP